MTLGSSETESEPVEVDIETMQQWVMDICYHSELWVCMIFHTEWSSLCDDQVEPQVMHLFFGVV